LGQKYYITRAVKFKVALYIAVTAFIMKNIIKNIWFLLFVFCLLLSGCGKKPPENKLYRIGILCGLDYLISISDSFKAKMTALGYIEGKNIVYDLQRTNFEPAKEGQILKKFVDDKVDLILTFPSEVSIAAKAAAYGTSTPVLFCFANIEDTNLVESVRRPGGNITGVRYPGPDIAVKRFEVMCELAPQAKRMWMPYQRGYPIVASQLKILHQVAAAKGITLIEFPASGAAEIQAGLDAISKSGDIGMDAILILVEPLGVTVEAFTVFAKFAAEHKIPVGGALISAGGYSSIFGVNVNLDGSGKQAAILADKILKGVPAGTIPVASSEGFFQINYTAAQACDITVPESLLSVADEIIR
jgi:putative ABC transport system substrate-binding protein